MIYIFFLACILHNFFDLPHLRSINSQVFFDDIYVGLKNSFFRADIGGEQNGHKMVHLKSSIETPISNEIENNQ